MLNVLLLSINIDNVIKAANITWKGMLALFVAMGLIYISILVLNKIKDKK